MSSPPTSSTLDDPRGWTAVAAAAAPSLLAYNVAPSPTFLNQALAFGLWGAFFIACAPRAPGRAPAPVWAALALVALGVLWSWLPGALPSSFALSALGTLAAAALALAAGAAARREADHASIFGAFATGWVVAGLLNVMIALVQVFAPGWADGNWIAQSGIPGRAVGNLRQPNHLSSLLLWSAIAVIALVELGQLGRRLAAALLALAVFGVVLTASRTGVLSVVLLAAWGLFDRRLGRHSRALLIAAPVIYALAWFGMTQWAALSEHSFGGARRLSEGDISSSRFGIWANTLALIRAEPWAGVGFGEFNLAWTLTPFPGRPTAFFDHTHNLPLQLLVELGLPLGSLVLLALLAGLWQAARRAFVASEAGQPGPRAALLIVLMIGLHSLLEYPLWYAYFLLPAAWAWGFALGTPTLAAARPAAPLRSGVPPPGRRGAAGASLPALAATAMVVAAALSVWDYLRVALIFASPEGAPPLEQRIEAGRRSWLFSHHADYAAVTSGVTGTNPAASFANTAHYLLDTRLMVAWSEWLARRGETERARQLAARLREFSKPEAEDFFEACPQGPAADPAAPFQCQTPGITLPWRAFLEVR